MVDTFMALWNQDRRKRARQMLLIFFLTFSLLCIGTSLLFVVVHRGFQHQRQQSSLGQQTPTVPAFGNTVVPDRTPTTSVQPTSGATATQTPPVATPTQHPPTATTQPCIGTPTRVASFSPRNLLQQGALLVGIRPLQPFDGGGPIRTPIVPSPTPIHSITPTPSHQPGWVPNCTTSNSVSVFVDSDTLALLRQNIGFILVSSMLGTGIFYAILFIIKRRME